jgi:hypothetical protein
LLPETSKGKEESISDEESDNDTGETSADTVSSQLYNRSRRSSLPTVTKQNHYGSFYLRMGAVGNRPPSRSPTGINWFYCSIRNWEHDLFRFRIWTIFRIRKRHQMPQRTLSFDAGDQNGVYFYTNVFHLPE